MQKSKLLDTLITFSQKELTRFEDFVKSPFFNKNTDLVLLFLYVKKFAPRFNNKKLSREIAFKELFPSEKFNEKKLGYLMSDLVELVDSFISYNCYTSDAILPVYHQLITYNERHLDKNYNNSKKKAELIQKKYPYWDTTYFFNQYLLASSSNLFFDKQKKHRYDQSLQNIADNLDLFYLALKLKYSCEIINRQNVVAVDYRLKLLNEVLSYIKNNDLGEIPAISIYYEILMTLLESDDISHFNNLKKLLKENADKFPIHETKDMFDYARNYCLKKINTGNHEFLHELFDIDKTLLEKEIIFVEKYLSPWTYKNMTTVALRLQEFDWAKSFVENYRNRLAPEYRENAYAFNLANIHFYRKEYSKAIRLLQKVEFSDVYYHLDSKTMLLKIYYETEDYDALSSLLDAFYMSLKRNKLVSDYMRTTYINLIRFIRKAIKLRDNETDKFENLIVKIKETKKVANLNWLIKQLQLKVDKKRSFA
ncbi:MAG: hypothetical protein JKX95_05520 [Bacteroidia bacterium]|nr:hypothetical protein [Bacteroidia bacterium]